MLRAAVSIVAVAVALVPCVVRADTPPSVWERARDPRAAEAFALHEAVQQRLVRTSLTEIDLGERERVRAMLEHAGAEHHESPLLRFDLAHVYSLLENHGRAADVLKAAIADFPDHPLVDQAWLRLAFACGHLGDHACEQRAYVEVLHRETEEVYRATPTLNLAETHMHAGDLKEAIEGYREALRIAARIPNRGETAPLATWGLAVALDRSGDRMAAEKEARFAFELELSMGVPRLLRSKDVFFVPAYEIHWYEGLGSAARARVARSARDAVTLWRAAERSFGEYVKIGESKTDRWLPIAKARLLEAKMERERAERAAPRESPKAPSFGSDVTL